MRCFATGAWRPTPRDRFIGWTPELRKRSLSHVVENPHFLILPWLHIPNLGAHILAIVRHRLIIDWTARYNTTSVLIKTFLETLRHICTVYRPPAGPVSAPPRGAVERLLFVPQQGAQRPTSEPIGKVARGLDTRIRMMSSQAVDGSVLQTFGSHPRTARSAVAPPEGWLG